MKKSVVYLLLLAIIVSLALLTFASHDAEEDIFEEGTGLYYQNPFNIEGQWVDGKVIYGIGDPFVMKYNGMYYLYASTANNAVGIRVWSSDNLVDWKYEGDCTDGTDEITNTAYAPEVTYWDGIFYLYTATPGGEKHRTFTSKNPTGPFLRQNDTFSVSGDLIDGSVYIDDDENATKYFLHAGGGCIEYGYLSDNMLKATGKNYLSNVTVCGKWTEGPSVFKRGEKYYITYTGNHVLADNYMIEYAAGGTLKDLKEPKDNIILINTEEGNTGLGHNSTVVGPDLDSRYIIYHSLVTGYPERLMNIDRIVFNGEKLEVQGPTWWNVQNPKMPQFYDRMANSDNWDKISGTNDISDGFMNLSGESLNLSKQSSENDYTAEINMSIAGYTDESAAGAIVSYTDENNYAYVFIEPYQNKIFLNISENGVITEESAKLPDEYTYSDGIIRKLTIKKENSTFDIYVDDRLLITADGNLSGGKIGLKTENCTAKFGYTAFSSTVNSNEDKDTVKPTGSEMDAVHANGTSRSFSIDTITDPDAGLKSQYVKDLKADDTLFFRINPQESSYYSADIKAMSQNGAKVNLYVDGSIVAKNVNISASDDFITTAARNIRIDKNAKVFKIKIIKGKIDLYSIKLTRLADIFETSISQNDIEFEWLEGNWNETANTISATNSSVWSKASYGTESWGDYEISADVNLKNGGNAGLLVRLKYATGSSDAETGIGGCIDPDYNFGYYACISDNGVILGKQMFNWKELKSVSKTILKGTDYNIKVRAEGANIKVYLNDELLIDYIDLDCPIMEGKIGLRSMNTSAGYKNITLTHLNPAETIGVRETIDDDAAAITKNRFIFHSNANGKGYVLKNGSVTFNESLRSIKGYLKDIELINGTVSCDIKLPSDGIFGTGIVVRSIQGAFGDNTDDLDGIAVQLERGFGRDLDVIVQTWENSVWKGALKTVTIKDYFSGDSGKTANLKVNVNGNVLTAYVDGESILTADIRKWGADASRNCIGLRSHNSTHITVSNFKYEVEE